MSAQIKECNVATDHGIVDFVHLCAFCGWSRVAPTAVVLPAGCPQCGCAVDSRDAHDAALATDPSPAALPASRALRALLWLFAAGLVVTAARAGNSVAGLSGATTAVGLAGFLLLPFVPARLPAKR